MITLLHVIAGFGFGLAAFKPKEVPIWWVQVLYTFLAVEQICRAFQ